MGNTLEQISAQLEELTVKYSAVSLELNRLKAASILREHA